MSSLICKPEVVDNNVCISYVGKYAIFMNELDEIYVEEIPQEVIFLGEVKDTALLTPLKNLPEDMRTRILIAIS